jgi:hypothetical protein
MLFDAFISHAWEDKDDFVRELAERLQAQRIEVWYDEFSLKVGDSLRRSIDLGLSKSRFGIVVFSKSFFDKQWTNWELDGLVQRQNSSDYNLIIPIWHGIDKKEMLEYSPSLVDKIAIKSSRGMDYVVKQVDSIINPKGSTLIIARDILIKHGVEPPVITDDWWLDVIEYCGNEFPHHEYLWFSIPWKSWNPQDRGVYIGLSALQMLWQQRADEMQISQLTHPSEVLSFIESQPGLKNACMKEPIRTAFYLPQLSIKTFGGFLEPSFDALVKAGTKYQTKHDCEEEVALRHPQFGHYDFTELADIYFAGAGGGIGPSTRRYDLIDCLIWLLSDKSSWLPKGIRTALYTGLIDWGVWDWREGESSRSDFVSNAATGSLAHALYRAMDKVPIKLTKKIQQDIKTRIKHSKSILNLPETVDELVEIFYKKKIIESWIRSKHEIEKRRNRKNS